MASRDAQDSILSADRAFVVHLAPAGGSGRRRFIGRVEHLSSGETIRFTSLRALLAFLAIDRADPRRPETSPGRVPEEAAMTRRPAASERPPPGREQCTPAAPRRSTRRNTHD